MNKIMRDYPHQYRPDPTYNNTRPATYKHNDDWMKYRGFEKDLLFHIERRIAGKLDLIWRNTNSIKTQLEILNAKKEKL